MDFDPPENPSAELAKITGEICERLSELDALKANSSFRLIASLYRLSLDSVAAYSLLLAIANDGQRICESFENTGIKRGISKQAAHAEHQQNMLIIQRHFPQIAAHIANIRKHAHHGHGNHNQLAK